MGGCRAGSLTVDERCCRGNWSVPKTESSTATIGVPRSVIERIHRLKKLEVEINWGGKGAKKKFKVVRSAEPHDLVFQSVVKGTSMNDQNIVRRHLRPAALKLKLNPKKVTWRALRTSYGTWMVQSGANPKDVQAQMRHSRISTTMDIYAQFVPESQQAAVARMVDMVEKASGESNRYVLVRNPQSDSPQVIENMVELVGIEPTTSSLRTMASANLSLLSAWSCLPNTVHFGPIQFQKKKSRLPGVCLTTELRLH